MKKIFLIFSLFLHIFFFFASFSVMGANMVYANDSEQANILPKPTEMEKAKKFILQDNARPDEIIAVSVDSNNPMVGFLTTIQKILLRLVLPIVAVGCGIYIAYELFTAEGDESKMSAAWKAILYSVVAIICIGLSALIVSVISRLNIGG